MLCFEVRVICYNTRNDLRCMSVIRHIKTCIVNMYIKHSRLSVTFCERVGLADTTSMFGYINRVMCGVNLSAEQPVDVSTTFDTLLAALLLIE